MRNSASRIGSNGVLCLGCFPCAPGDDNQCHNHSLPGKDEQESITYTNQLKQKNDVGNKKDVFWMTSLKCIYAFSLVSIDISLIFKLRPASQSRERNTPMLSGSLQFLTEYLECRQDTQTSAVLFWFLYSPSSLLDPWQLSDEVDIFRYFYFIYLLPGMKPGQRWKLDFHNWLRQNA